MFVSYLEDRGLEMASKEKCMVFSYEKKPPKLARPVTHDCATDEKTPTSLVNSPEDALFSRYSSNPRPWTTYFSQCFTVVDILGEGSFGKVYKALSHSDQKMYAVKIDKSRVRNDAHRNFKLEEVKRHEQLSHHPNIVRLHHAWEEKRIIYIQLELCETSLQLFSHCQNQMKESQIWNVLIDILWALQYIHSLNFIHLDVKLDNILIGFDGRYKLSDFGLVYNMASKTGRDPMEGDAKYLAPELLINTFTTAADIFSLGISVLELAANVVLPNQGPVWQALRQNKLPRAQTRHLSIDLLYVISWMMSSDYKQRPSADKLLKNPSILPKVRTWNQVLSYREVRGHLLAWLRALVIIPITKMASVCSQAFNFLFYVWNSKRLHPPIVHVQFADFSGTPPNTWTKSHNVENFETPCSNCEHQDGSASSTFRNLRNRRCQASLQTVKKNLFNSFSSGDEDE